MTLSKKALLSENWAFGVGVPTDYYGLLWMYRAITMDLPCNSSFAALRYLNGGTA